jgi:hypothetical protein
VLTSGKIWICPCCAEQTLRFHKASPKFYLCIQLFSRPRFELSKILFVRTPTGLFLWRLTSVLSHLDRYAAYIICRPLPKGLHARKTLVPSRYAECNVQVNVIADCLITPFSACKICFYLLQHVLTPQHLGVINIQHLEGTCQPVPNSTIPHKPPTALKTTSTSPISAHYIDA